MGGGAGMGLPLKSGGVGKGERERGDGEGWVRRLHGGFAARRAMCLTGRSTPRGRLTPAQAAGEVEAEAVDVVLLHPVDLGVCVCV